jgi:hypothetical protein
VTFIQIVRNKESFLLVLLATFHKQPMDGKKAAIGWAWQPAILHKAKFATPKRPGAPLFTKLP